MKEGTHPQAEGCTTEETTHCKDICDRRELISWFENLVEKGGKGQAQSRGDEMRPDVDRLVVPV